MVFSGRKDSQVESHQVILYWLTNFIDGWLIERWKLVFDCGNINDRIGLSMQRACGSLLIEEILDPLSL
jgi:hypothetical protein